MKGLRAVPVVSSQYQARAECAKFSRRSEPAGVLNHDVSTMTTLNLSKLEARVDELIRAISDLSDENRALIDQQSNLMTERAALIEKSELARSRVESMIARLKAMEVSS